MNESNLEHTDLQGNPAGNEHKPITEGACENIASLRSIVGAMLFGARDPVSISKIRGILDRVAEKKQAQGLSCSMRATDSEIRAELEKLKLDLAESDIGLAVIEIAGGFRLMNTPECGPWLRELLNVGKPLRLSLPALETLAIIAFRQPVTRSQIESVRGVNVDSIVRLLLEAQLIKITGRSDLPGRPMLYGTTQFFLEHFGLKDLKELPCRDEMLKRASHAGEIKIM